jgi:hypothetical protein
MTIAVTPLFHRWRRWKGARRGEKGGEKEGEQREKTERGRG